MSIAVAADVGAIYERHAPEIHDFLVRTVHDHAIAEDLTQAAFIRLLERGDTVREIDKVRPWLFTVAHNLAVTHVTRRRATDPIDAAFDIASGEKGPEDEALATAAAALVWDAARSLEPRQYAVLDLSVRRGFTVGEIAEVLEITAAHAAVVVHRAREALAQAIRLLVVVRQRRHCDRLAEIVPAGTDVLTPDLRASVDRHMRRCEVCKQVGARLTEPVELFAALPLLPLPLALRHLPAVPHVGAASHAAAGHASHAARAGSGVQHAAQKLGHALMQPAALAGIAAVVVMGTGLGLALRHGGGTPSTAAASGASHPSSGLGTGPGGATGPAPAAGAPLGGDAVVPVGARGTGSRVDGGVEPAGATLTLVGDGAFLTSDGPAAPPPSPNPGPPPSPAPAPPLLEIGPSITIGPVGPIANPLPVPLPVHVVVSQSGNPSVTVTPPPALPAAHRAGSAPSLPIHRL